MTYLRYGLAAAGAAALAFGTATAQERRGPPPAPAAAILVCNLDAIGVEGPISGSGRRQFRRFDAEFASGVDRRLIARVRRSETCAEALGHLEAGDPNPKCSTSVAVNKFVATCDLTAPIPPEN